MANGLDRIERLFSKKRPALSRKTTASNIYGSAPSTSAQSDPPSPEFLFPQASFIRVNVDSKLHARDELDISLPKSIAPTTSSSSRGCSWRLSNSDVPALSDGKRQSTHSTTASFHFPSRSSSLLSRRHDRKPGGPTHLRLPSDTESSTTKSPPRLSKPIPTRPPPAPPTCNETKNAQKCLLEALPIYPAQRFETPPPSDQDDFNFPSPSMHGRLPSTGLNHYTPEASPDMISRRVSTASEPKRNSGLKRISLPQAPPRRATSTASSAPLLNDDWRDSYVPDVDATVSPKGKQSVQEPPVQEFLTLTDEDIAEVKIKAPSKPPARLPPPPPVLPPTARSPPFVPTSRASRMLSAPLAPDEVAAFQAARIAKKYDFDFLYIVNFWPSRMNHLHRPSNASKYSSHSSSTSSSAASSFSKPPSILYSPTSDCPTTKNSTPRNSMQGPSEENTYNIADCCPESSSVTVRPRMTSRILAGYGLNTLDAPFRLSMRAHRKMLREGTKGWTEYRKSDAKDNEFARGYARAFYTGCTQASVGPSLQRSSMSNDSTTNGSSSSDTTTAQTEAAVQPTGAADAGKACSRKASTKPVIDRGIVFAAYRRPRDHGGTVHSSKAELDALEKEAETLVELILDFHQGRRRWELHQEEGEETTTATAANGALTSPK